MTSTTTLTDKDRETLNAAADWLETYGWVQGRMYERRLDSDQEVSEEPCGACAFGAIIQGALKVYGEEPAVVDGTDTQARYLAERRIGYAISAHFGVNAVPNWNDATGRTKDEVVAGLREVASL